MNSEEKKEIKNNDNQEILSQFRGLIRDEIKNKLMEELKQEILSEIPNKQRRSQEVHRGLLDKKESMFKFQT